jgi:predicted dehydrogenase
MNIFSWAFIGCGGIAHITAKELLKTPGQKIVSCWNRTYEKAEDFAAQYGCTAYQSAEEAILAPGVDGVYIAVTADQHEFFMRMCIRHHKPVLCEKPFTVNAKQAASVLEYASQEGVYVSEAMWTWHNATAQKVKQWIQAEEIGNILEVKSDYSFPMNFISKKERHFSPHMIGGALLDIGVYCIRYCYELFGMPQEIICKGRLANGIDLGEHITLRYDGFDCILRISRDESDGERFHITGEHGSIKVPMFHMAQKAVLKGEKTQRFRDNSLLYGKQFAAVAEEIRSGAKAGIAITAQSTIDCMKIMDICRQQIGLVYPCEIEE